MCVNISWPNILKYTFIKMTVYNLTSEALHVALKCLLTSIQPTGLNQLELTKSKLVLQNRLVMAKCDVYFLSTVQKNPLLVASIIWPYMKILSLLVVIPVFDNESRTGITNWLTGRQGRFLTHMS